jgi:cohesin complex subunit SA-1/2
MDLEVYLEMRQVTAYEQLWDDITRQFVSHSDVILLEKAMEAISVLRVTQALSATNSEKESALEAAVIEPLRQLLDGIDANNATPLDEDIIQKLTAWLTRLCLILKNWDVTPALIEVGPGNAPTVLEAVNQLVERGQMGFQEEEKVSEPLRATVATTR